MTHQAVARPALFAALCFLLFLASALVTSAGAALAGSEEGRLMQIRHAPGVWITNGDAIQIRDTRYRIWGIKTPSKFRFCTSDRTHPEPYACGESARLALKALVRDSVPVCHPRGEDDRGRSLALCIVDGTDIGTWMIERGFAVQWEWHAAGKYDEQEDEARAARRGLWSVSMLPCDVWSVMTPHQKDAFPKREEPCE